jgi:hypothetical protein
MHTRLSLRKRQRVSDTDDLLHRPFILSTVFAMADEEIHNSFSGDYDSSGLSDDGPIEVRLQSAKDPLDPLLAKFVLDDEKESAYDEYVREQQAASAADASFDTKSASSVDEQDTEMGMTEGGLTVPIVLETAASDMEDGVSQLNGSVNIDPSPSSSYTIDTVSLEELEHVSAKILENGGGGGDWSDSDVGSPSMQATTAETGIETTQISVTLTEVTQEETTTRVMVEHDVAMQQASSSMPRSPRIRPRATSAAVTHTSALVDGSHGRMARLSPRSPRIRPQGATAEHRLAPWPPSPHIRPQSSDVESDDDVASVMLPPSPNVQPQNNDDVFSVPTFNSHDTYQISERRASLVPPSPHIRPQHEDPSDVEEDAFSLPPSPHMQPEGEISLLHHSSPVISSSFASIPVQFDESLYTYQVRQAG